MTSSQIFFQDQYLLLYSQIAHDRTQNAIKLAVEIMFSFFFHRMKVNEKAKITIFLISSYNSLVSTRRSKLQKVA